MANSNKKSKFKPGQGKTPQQYTDSTRFAWYGVVGMIIILILASLLSGCTTTKKCCDKEHVITETDGDRIINWYSTKEKR
jgi:hypothetical protein